MKISRDWLQGFFKDKLPEAEVLADALTFHAFEIESVENGILDVKVTPNRGHDCLSHRGIAKELSAILKMPMNAENDPFTRSIDLSKKTDAVEVRIADDTFCRRYIAGYIRNVKVGPSPDWLRRSLESIGQKSINNVVDITNLVMFNTGQPLHAFDAGKLKAADGKYAIGVRSAKKGEKMLALDDKEYTLSEKDSVIIDGNADIAIGVAGVKGGKPSGVGEATKDIILEAANFDGVRVRKTSQAMKLRTDASERFQQVISPELAAVGMQQAVDLFVQLCGGEIEGYVDVYPHPQQSWNISVSNDKINSVLGTSFAAKESADVFTRLGLTYSLEGGTFTVTPPSERLDLQVAADLIEEVGRIEGYDKVPTVELLPVAKSPAINKNFAAAERIREELVAQGYSEVYTSVFADKGEHVVANKVDGVRPYLRSNLTDGLLEALERNRRMKDLLGLKEVKLFEIGTIWNSGREYISFAKAEEAKKGSTHEENAVTPVEADLYVELPVSTTERYRTFSKYPFIVRDIALWVPTGTDANSILKVILDNAGELVVRSEKFDEYKNEKTGKTSYAFRLVFQSFDTTLTDTDANERMESVYRAVKEKGWEVR